MIELVRNSADMLRIYPNAISASEKSMTAILPAFAFRNSGFAYFEITFFLILFSQKSHMHFLHKTLNLPFLSMPFRCCEMCPPKVVLIGIGPDTYNLAAFFTNAQFVRIQ